SVLWALDARYPRSRGPARLEDPQRHGSTPRGPLRHVPEREPHREDPHGGEQRVPLPVALPARTRVVAPPVELERHAGPCIERIEHEDPPVDRDGTLPGEVGELRPVQDVRERAVLEDAPHTIV